MKYYILDESVNLKEIGNYPQSTEMVKGYDYDAPDTIYLITRNRTTHIPVKVNMNGIVIRKSAKLTDVLSVAMASSQGFFVNDRLRQILENYKLVDHEYHPASCKYKDTTISGYSWIHFMSDLKRMVNFSESEFYMGGEAYKFRDCDEYLKFKDTVARYNAVTSTKLVMLPEFDTSLDLFVISGFDINVYISERLARELAANKVSGIEIREQAILSFS